MTTRISAEQYRKETAKPKRSKYGNRKTVYDGITFDSKKEADYYAELKLREKAGEVFEVEIQRPFALVVDGYLIGTYRADFWFHDAVAKRNRCVDTKGVETDVFIMKKKLMKAIHKIDVEVV